MLSETALRKAPGGLHILTEMSYHVTDPVWLVKFTQHLNEMMEEFINKAKKAYPDFICVQKAQPLLVVGTPVSRIIEIAQKKKVSMIIVGSHGRTGLSHALLGSKAEKLVQLSPIPVIVIKPSKKS